MFMRKLLVGGVAIALLATVPAAANPKATLSEAQLAAKEAIFHKAVVKRTTIKTSTCSDCDNCTEGDLAICDARFDEGLADCFRQFPNVLPAQDAGLEMCVHMETLNYALCVSAVCCT